MHTILETYISWSQPQRKLHRQNFRRVWDPSRSLFLTRSIIQFAIFSSKFDLQSFYWRITSCSIHGMRFVWEKSYLFLFVTLAICFNKQIMAVEKSKYLWCSKTSILAWIKPKSKQGGENLYPENSVIASIHILFSNK